MSRVHKPHRWQWLWLIPAALLVWWPLWFLFMGALMSQEELRLTIGPALGLGTGYTVWHLLPDWPTLEPLLTLLLDTPQFFVMFWNSIGQSVAQVAGNLLVGAPAAWAISRLRFRGRSMVRGLYIVLMLLPFQVTMVPSYLVLRQFGLLDTPWAIILPGIFSTFPVFIMERGFDTVCLPATAVNSDNAGNFVYLVETKNTVLGVQSVLVRLGVTVEERGDGVVRISGALSGQEQIVSASSKPLSAGTEVRIDE